MAVFVVDKRKRPLDPCSEKRARQLLDRGRARVHKLAPFTIRMVDRCAKDSSVNGVVLQIRPRSRETGMAIVREDKGMLRALVLVGLKHRGVRIHKNLEQRANYRRRRRSANLRYRAPRFDNRRRPVGWLAPSLRHRVDTAMAWVRRFMRMTPVTRISMELDRFDTQKMQNPEISGIKYQQGELWGYEVREYLLEKWGRQCAYCGAENVPLQVDHINPRAHGGSDRVSNLTLACRACNEKKAAQPVEEFLRRKPEVLARILKQAKSPLRDAAAVNSVRWSVLNSLRAAGLPVSTWSGGRTKWNRMRFGVPKAAWLDALCVGAVDGVIGIDRPAYAIACTGRGSHQRTKVDKYGFPRGYCIRKKHVRGFATGDFVVADVPGGKLAGRHMGRVSVRKSGSFCIQTGCGKVDGISWKYCRILQRGDGYGYSLVPGEKTLQSAPPCPEEQGFCAGAMG